MKNKIKNQRAIASDGLSFRTLLNLGIQTFIFLLLFICLAYASQTKQLSLIIVKLAYMIDRDAKARCDTLEEYFVKKI